MNTSKEAHHENVSTTPNEAHLGNMNDSISLPTGVSNDTLNSKKVENQGERSDNQTDTETNLSRNITNAFPGSSNETITNVGKAHTRRRLLEEKTGDQDVHAATVENEGGLDTDADSSFELFRDNDELADEYNYDYDDYVDENMWGDEEWTEEEHEKIENYVNVDAHVLCTPVSLIELKFYSVAYITIYI